jgi:hypothetical protein
MRPAIPETPEYTVALNYRTPTNQSRNITLEVPGNDEQDALMRATKKLTNDRRRKIQTITNSKATPLPLTTIIADGLDKCVGGPGWNATHQRAMNLANAAPAMRAFLERAARLVKDGECPNCLLDGDSENEDCDDHHGFEMANDDAVTTLHALITDARNFTGLVPYKYDCARCEQPIPLGQDESTPSGSMHKECADEYEREVPEDF